MLGGGGEGGSGFLLFFSAQHLADPCHDLSWGLTMRTRRPLGPFNPIQASTVDGELPLADISVPADYTKDLLSGRQH